MNALIQVIGACKPLYPMGWRHRYLNQGSRTNELSANVWHDDQVLLGGLVIVHESLSAYLANVARSVAAQRPAAIHLDYPHVSPSIGSRDRSDQHEWIVNWKTPSSEADAAGPRRVG
jgi:hypothetical protein